MLLSIWPTAAPSPPRTTSPNSRIAVYPGSFDPVTWGHIDIAKRATNNCDRLIVAIGRNAAKTPMFTISERLAMLRQAFATNSRITVDAFDGSLAAYARSQGANEVVRGVRDWQDWVNEAPMMAVNFCLGRGLRTRLYKAQAALSDVSSSQARRRAVEHESLSDCVPEHVARMLEKGSGPDGPQKISPKM